MINLYRRTLLGLGSGLCMMQALPAWAGLRIAITGVGSNQIPIAIKPFALVGADTVPENLADIIGNDLLRTGGFRLIEAGEATPVAELEEPSDLKALNAKGANAVLVGVVSKIAPNRWDVRYFLHDPVSNALITSGHVEDSTENLRMAAHLIADDVYHKLTGEGPLFHSQLMYVTQLGPKHYQLVVTDSDGLNPRVVLSSPNPIISPVWSPNGRYVAYVSFEKAKPIVYLQELATGKRREISYFEGNNSAPAFSPDGQWLCVALSRGGRTQLWMLSVAGNELRRFSSSYGIDTEPTFSPDGQYVYFTSDRGGAPQIYRQPVAGGAAERITFGSNYAVSPDVSPDGKLLAFVTRQDGKYHTAIMDLQTGQVTTVTSTDHDESPSFAPNSRFVVFATREGNRGVLATASVDGRVVTRIEGDGDIREPQWGPIF